MSDADDSGFDKEAERERLREKYENEKKDRAAAEQMSDLLLKGATMTNAHCGNCGSPVFRQNGQEFCPNCSAEAQAAEAAESPDGEQPQQGSDEQQLADEQLADAVSGDEPEDSEPATGGTSIAERAAASVQSSDEPPQPEPDPSTASRQPETPTAQSTSQSTADDATLADAQQSLLNAITQHARAATGADPRTAKDHLEAANEAAEALDELSE